MAESDIVAESAETDKSVAEYINYGYPHLASVVKCKVLSTAHRMCIEYRDIGQLPQFAASFSVWIGCSTNPFSVQSALR